MMTTEESTALEMLVDRIGIAEVLRGLGSICVEKADHIRASYNDKHTAAVWENMNRHIIAASVTASARTLMKGF